MVLHISDSILKADTSFSVEKNISSYSEFHDDSESVVCFEKHREHRGKPINICFFGFTAAGVYGTYLHFSQRILIQ